MDLAIDVDNVVLDFLKTWEVACFAVLGMPAVTFNRNDYTLTGRYGMSQKEVDAVWAYFNANNMWENLDILPGADAALHNLRSHGFNIHCITAVGPEVHDLRMANLAAHNLDWVTLHCVGNNKLAKLIEIQPIAFADDNPFHHAEAEEAGVPHRILIRSYGHFQCSKSTHDFPSLAEASEWIIEQHAPARRRKVAT